MALSVNRLPLRPRGLVDRIPCGAELSDGSFDGSAGGRNGPSWQRFDGLTHRPEIRIVREWCDEGHLAGDVAGALSRGGAIEIRVRHQIAVYQVVLAICLARELLAWRGIHPTLKTELVRRGDHLNYVLTVGAGD